MKKIFLLFILLFLLNSCKENIIAYNNLLIDNRKISKDQAELIYNKVNKFPNRAQLSISLVDNGKVKFIGIERLNDTVFEIINHSKVFEIGSLSKLFTSTILSNFILEKQLELDENINDYLDFPLKDSVKITFKQLANHTSGLPKMPNNINYTDKNNKFKDYDDKKIEEYIKKYMELSFTPGENSSYSNIGVGILGYMLGKISNSDYEYLLNKYIISKYKMNKTSIIHKKIKRYLVKGISSKGNEVSQSKLSSLTPAGGVLSSADDLSKFALAQFDKKNIDLELTRQKTFQIDDESDQGLGWRIENRTDSKLYCHNGKTKGYSSSIALDVEKKNGVIVLANVATFQNSNKDIIENLCLDLLSLINLK